jgi:nicotinamide mononucleotide transporter
MEIRGKSECVFLMPIETIVAGLVATSRVEWAAFVLGVIYIVLIIRRQRLGWVAGAASSILLAGLAYQSKLPMQALLQLAYVAAAAYGWWTWAPSTQPDRVSTRSWRWHAVVLAVSALVSAGLAQLLAAENASAWPFLDSFVACGGLIATWLVARVSLDNWYYWIVIDAISMLLFFTQGLYATTLLYVVYFLMALWGLRTWLQLYRKQGVSA